MHSKFEKSKLEEHYDSLALNYDGVYKKAGYLDPAMVAKHAEKEVKDQKMDA